LTKATICTGPIGGNATRQRSVDRLDFGWKHEPGGWREWVSVTRPAPFRDPRLETQLSITPLPIKGTAIVRREADPGGTRTTFTFEEVHADSWRTTMQLHLSTPPTDHDLRELGRACLLACES
jgi:hypothetical protein